MWWNQEATFNCDLVQIVAFCENPSELTFIIRDDEGSKALLRHEGDCLEDGLSLMNHLWGLETLLSSEDLFPGLRTKDILYLTKTEGASFKVRSL